MFTFGQGLPVTKTMTKSTESMFSMLKLRTKIADMVTAYLEKKQEHNVMDYGDLVRYAAIIATKLDEVRVIEREKYKIVLLDEFQDTSHAQLQLFSHLFGGGAGYPQSNTAPAGRGPSASL